MKYTNIILTLTTALILLQIADITTTTMLLSNGGTETNPFADISIIQAILKLLLPVVLGLLGIVPTKYSNPFKNDNEQNFYQKLILATISFLILIYLGVIINNTYLILITTRYSGVK